MTHALSPRRTAALLPALLCALSLPAFAIDSALTYQGHLTDAGQPAAGSYDLQFTLQDTSGTTLGSPIVVDNANVVGGVFTVELDFGPSAFSGADRFLQIGVRRGSESGAFTALSPRSAVTPTPYAQTSAAAEFAASVANNSIGSAQVVDASVGSADIDTSMQRRISGACASGSAIATISASGSVTCESGLQGAPGATGAQGPPGATGPQGPQGTAGSADAWSRTGNAGTDTTNFIGTTDGQPFVVRIYNLPVARYETDGYSPNIIQGWGNRVMGGSGSVIAGGGYYDSAYGNRITDSYSVIGGGSSNLAGDDNGDSGDSTYATVAGGAVNQARGGYSSVSGGSSNQALGTFSAVSGGTRNCAGGAYSWAGGRFATVRPGTATNGVCNGSTPTGDANGDEGTFVWADSQNAPFPSTGANQFNVRASGGVRLNDDTNLNFGATTRQMLNLWGAAYGIGVQPNVFYFRTNDHFAWYRFGSHTDTADSPGAGGNLLMTLTPAAVTTAVTGYARATLFQSTSDRNAKTAFAAIDPIDVLARVLELPVSTWSFKTSTGQRHIGPMAQDFHAAFGLNGEDDKSIATVDADGVALAAIQGLNAKLEAENAALRARLDAIETALRRLER